MPGRQRAIRVFGLMVTKPSSSRYASLCHLRARWRIAWKVWDGGFSQPSEIFREIVAQRVVSSIGLSLAVWLVCASLASARDENRGASAAATKPAAAELTFNGAPRPALDWNKCDEFDISDEGLRAFRDAKSQVVEIAGASKTRTMRGPSLLDMKKPCSVELDSAENPDPVAHNDRTFLTSLWTPDGVNILGIGHDEYHGESHPGRCLGTTPRQCRYGTLVFLDSHDGGEHFERTPTRPLAAVPVRQAINLGRDTGFFQPSNIFHWGNAEYVFVRTSGGGVQKPATCLLRSEKPLDPELLANLRRQVFPQAAV